jgi:hypothetical protein
MSILAQELLFNLNNNPIVTAICVFFINCGGRYVLNDLTKDHEKLFKTAIFRVFTVASILYISTRNILITLTFTTIYIFILDYLWNKNSHFCIFKKKIERAYDYVEDMIMGDSDEEDDEEDE